MFTLFCAINLVGILSWEPKMKIFGKNLPIHSSHHDFQIPPQIYIAALRLFGEICLKSCSYLPGTTHCVYCTARVPEQMLLHWLFMWKTGNAIILIDFFCVLTLPGTVVAAHCWDAVSLFLNKNDYWSNCCYWDYQVEEYEKLPIQWDRKICGNSNKAHCV